MEPSTTMSIIAQKSQSGWQMDLADAEVRQGCEAHLAWHSQVLSVKSGTQIIDRCWRFLKDRITISQHLKVGSTRLRATLRSAQHQGLAIKMKTCGKSPGNCANRP